MKESFVETMRVHFRAGTPIIAINTDEEKRCIQEIRLAGWKAADGTHVELNEKTAADLAAVLKLLKLPNDTFSAPYTISDGKGAIKKRKYYYKFDTLYPMYLEAQSKWMDGPKEETQLKQILTVLNFGFEVVEYDIITGFSDAGKEHDPCANMLEDALKGIFDPRFETDKIFVFKDCHQRMSGDSDGPRRMARNYFSHEQLTQMGAARKHLIFVQPDWAIHRDLQSCVAMVEFSLPNEKDLDDEVKAVEKAVEGQTDPCPIEVRSQLVTGLRGFTQMEAVNALAYGMSKHRQFCPEMVTTVRRLQQANFAKDRVLTLVDDDDIASISEVGGFENAIQFAEECKACYTPEARKLGLKRPKGCLLLGIPGTGKSLFGKVMAKIMDLPLIIYDVSAQFGGLVGETEAYTRQALKKIKAKGPSVVLIDEADKVFAGMGGGYQGDGGVATRMLGYILSFMANENEDSFMIMTMNRTLGVPKELLRAGRLDRLFYTTFPSARERLEILGIHLKKNGANLEEIDDEVLEKLVEDTEQYVGAELEQIVIKAVRSAFFNGKELTPSKEELEEAVLSVKPLAKLDEEGIKAMDDYCKQSATPVSVPEAESKVFLPTSRGRRQIRIDGNN